jgi:hypothetical protein
MLLLSGLTDSSDLRGFLNRSLRSLFRFDFALKRNQSVVSQSGVYGYSLRAVIGTEHSTKQVEEVSPIIRIGESKESSISRFKCNSTG